MVIGLLYISMLLDASSCNHCLFIVEFYWNIKILDENFVIIQQYGDNFKNGTVSIKMSFYAAEFCILQFVVEMMVK